MFGKILIIILALSLRTYGADPIHRGLNFQMNFKKVDGTTMNHSNLTVNVKILSGVAATDCLLLEEQHQGVSVLNGNLKLQIGKGTRLNQITSPLGLDTARPLVDVMYNSTTLSGLPFVDGSAGCSLNDLTNIQPRILRLSFKDNAQDVVADFKIRGQGFAVNAEAINGIKPDSLLKIQNGLNQQKVEELISTILTPVDNPANEGKSFRYNSSTGELEAFNPIENASGLPNSSVTSAMVISLPFNKLSALPFALSSTKGLKECTGNQILKYDGSAWQCAQDLGDEVVSVANKTGVIVLSVDDLSNFTANMDTQISGLKAQINGIASLSALGKIPISQIISGAACSNGQGFSYNSITDTISCAVLGSTVSNAATLAQDKIWVGDTNNKSQAVITAGDLAINTAGSASLISIAGNGTFFKVNIDSKGRVTGGTALTETDLPDISVSGDLDTHHRATKVAQLQGRAVDSIAPLDGQGLVWDNAGAKWKPNYIRFKDVVTSWVAGNQMIPATGCLANQTMNWTSVANRFSCQNIETLAVSNFSTGNFAATRLPAASASTSGIVNQTTQSLAGIKTFTSNLIGQQDMTVSGVVYANGGLTTTDFTASGNVTVTGSGSFDRVKLGNSSTSCTGSSDEGKMRYNSSTKVMQFCAGANGWLNL